MFLFSTMIKQLSVIIPCSFSQNRLWNGISFYGSKIKTALLAIKGFAGKRDLPLYTWPCKLNCTLLGNSRGNLPRKWGLMFWQPMIQRQGSIKALEFVSYALFKAYFHNIWRNHTGESLSEELVFAATNPQYDKRLFIELRV